MLEHGLGMAWELMFLHEFCVMEIRGNAGLAARNADRENERSDYHRYSYFCSTHSVGPPAHDPLAASTGSPGLVNPRCWCSQQLDGTRGATQSSLEPKDRGDLCRESRVK